MCETWGFKVSRFFEVFKRFRCCTTGRKIYTQKHRAFRLSFPVSGERRETYDVQDVQTTQGK